MRMTELEGDSGLFKRKNETQLTYDLKMAAWEWRYRESGCRVIGIEVKLEGPFGRIVDLAAIGPQNIFYIVEVKSSRSDFAKDDHTAGDFSELQSRERAFTGRTRLAKDTLRQAVCYAKETRPDSWREVHAFKQALTDFRRLEEKEAAFRKGVVRYSTKFHDPTFMSIADFHYLIAPNGVINRNVLPPQWGLIDETGTVSVPAEPKKVRKDTGVVSNFLRAIARSNTISMMRSQGIPYSRSKAGAIRY